MTVESLIERLKVAYMTPQNTETSPSVPAKSISVSLGESTLSTPRTSRTPEKIEGQRKSTEFTHAATPVLPATAPTMAPEPAPKSVPKFSVSALWRAADREFQSHYWRCPQCIAGGRSHGPLCPTGAQLHQQYEEAAMSDE